MIPRPLLSLALSLAATMPALTRQASAEVKTDGVLAADAAPAADSRQGHQAAPADRADGHRGRPRRHPEHGPSASVLGCHRHPRPHRHHVHPQEGVRRPGVDSSRDPRLRQGSWHPGEARRQATLQPKPSRPLVKHGLAEYGMSGVGPGKDSEGSDWIIQTLEKERRSPPLDHGLGRAPIRSRRRSMTCAPPRPAPQVDRLLSKLRVYTISDQDDSGAWMRKNFPTLFYIVSPGRLRRRHLDRHQHRSCPASTTRPSATNGSRNTFSKGMGRSAPRIRMWRTAWRATRRPGSG